MVQEITMPHRRIGINMEESAPGFLVDWRARVAAHAVPEKPFF
jgi:hypothetical protein